MTEQVLYRHHYKAIAIDFPRSYTSWVANQNPESNRSVERHYKVMRRKDILEFCREIIPQLADPKGCHIFNWTSGPFLEQTFQEFREMKAKYSSSAFYWLKMRREFADGQVALTTTDYVELESLMHVGMGHTTRKNIEPVLIGRIGSPKRVAKNIRELIIAPLREYSRKPDEFYDRVRQYCEGPYLDLFSRYQREHWTTWGDEDGKFNSPQPKRVVKEREPQPPAPEDPNQAKMFE